jgi:hypothetical protein
VLVSVSGTDQVVVIDYGSGRKVAKDVVRTWR